MLLKQNRSNKLDTSFHPEPYKVVDKRGSEVTIKSSTGERNTHVKKYSCQEISYREYSVYNSRSARRKCRSPGKVPLKEVSAGVPCSRTLERLNCADDIIFVDNVLQCLISFP